MEKTVLGKLEWTLTLPTHCDFLVRFISLGDWEVYSSFPFFSSPGRSKS
ncbi:START domain-containing protein [Psidium guajava]|nr:START domain-containing protein [Psidium guajava]